MAHFASTVKTNWSVDSKGLLTHAKFLAKQAKVLFNQPLKRLSTERESLLIKNSISPLPLHKTLVLLKLINDSGSTFAPYERLALSKSTVFESSNLHFGPEVGVRSCKEDADVLGAWLKEVEVIAKDICVLNKTENFPLSLVHYADARSLGHLLGDQSIDFVITSPPYPNEKDYTRTTRLESVLMGFIANKADLRKLKHGLVRSNTRSIYSKDMDDKWVENMKNIQEIAHKIEQRRIELRKTSGFERNYARVTRLYFGGMARHLADLRPKLKRGALLAYVVGDQASYLRVMIRTGQLLGEIAKALGYELVNIDLFRTRISTSTKEQLREEVLILRWPK